MAVDTETLGVSEQTNPTIVERQEKSVCVPAEEPSPPDGGLRAWLVCLAAFWANGALFGVINNAGVFYVFYEDLYKGEDSFNLSLVGSLCIGTTFLLSPLAAILTNCLGIQKTFFIGAVLSVAGLSLSAFAYSLELLYLSHGVLFGAGASLAYTPSLVILGHYFKRRLSLVNGIVAAGSSISTMALPLLLKFYFGKFGLSATYGFLLIKVAPVLICGLAFRPILNTRPTLVEEGERRKTEGLCNSKVFDCSIWKNMKYLVWAISFPVCLFGYFVPYVHLVKHCKDILPEYEGGLLIICIGAASIAGRIMSGFIADVPGINRILLQQLSFFAIGVLTMLISVANAYWILIVICLGMGIFDGCFITLLGPIAFDIVGPKQASQAIGFLLGICSVPLTLGPPIAGWMYDHLGKNYQLAFVAAGVPPIVGALLMFCIRLVKDKPPPMVSTSESQEFESMLKPSETKESKLEDDGQAENGVWKRQSAGTGAVELIGIKKSIENDEKVRLELIERHSTC